MSQYGVIDQGNPRQPDAENDDENDELDQRQPGLPEPFFSAHSRAPRR